MPSSSSAILRAVSERARRPDSMQVETPQARGDGFDTGKRFDGSPDLLCHPDCAGTVRRGQQEHELVPAEARGNVPRTDRGADGPGHGAQGIVPGGVTEAIIFGFEIVDVEHQAREHRFRGTCALRGRRVLLQGLSPKPSFFCVAIRLGCRSETPRSLPADVVSIRDCSGVREVVDLRLEMSESMGVAFVAGCGLPRCKACITNA